MLLCWSRSTSLMKGCFVKVSKPECSNDTKCFFTEPILCLILFLHTAAGGFCTSVKPILLTCSYTIPSFPVCNSYCSAGYVSSPVTTQLLLTVLSCSVLQELSPLRKVCVSHSCQNDSLVSFLLDKSYLTQLLLFVFTSFFPPSLPLLLSSRYLAIQLKSVSFPTISVETSVLKTWESVPQLTFAIRYHMTSHVTRHLTSVWLAKL